MAETLRAAAIVSFTSSGSTPSAPPASVRRVPILGCTPNINVAPPHGAGLGGEPGVHLGSVRFDEMVGKACRIAKREEMATNGQRLVIIAGMPFGRPGTTNILRIAWVEEGDKKDDEG